MRERERARAREREHSHTTHTGPSLSDVLDGRKVQETLSHISIYYIIYIFTNSKCTRVLTFFLKKNKGTGDVVADPRAAAGPS